MAKEITIKMLEEDVIALQKRQYEFNGLLSIIGYMAKDRIIDYEAMQEEINEAEKKGIALEMEKAIVSHKYCPQDRNVNDADWSTDFYNSSITFNFIKEPSKNRKKYTFPITETDLNEIQLLQYEYNISLSIYTYLKETYDINPKILKEYMKVVTSRGIELEKCKNKIANKYKPDQVNLSTYDWSIDFIIKVITYEEVKNEKRP